MVCLFIISWKFKFEFSFIIWWLIHIWLLKICFIQWCRYNFHLFPRDELNIGMPSYSFSCQVSHLTSMAREGFDFDACIYDGKPYCGLFASVSPSLTSDYKTWDLWETPLLIEEEFWNPDFQSLNHLPSKVSARALDEFEGHSLERKQSTITFSISLSLEILFPLSCSLEDIKFPSLLKWK